GYDAWGFDPHPRATGIARGTLETIELAAGRADAVTLWHTLEHVQDPAAALRRVHGWLAPGGAVIVAVPNLDSWQARAGGARWFHLDVPRHRTHFTPAGIGRLLDREGFTVLAVQHQLLEHNPFGLWQSVLNRIGGRPSWLFALLKGNAHWDWAQAALCLAAVPMVPLAIAIEALAGARRHGGTIVVLARRRL
nr:class I SAM-dependent methyltransferase [Actinomycetota bacterium]